MSRPARSRAAAGFLIASLMCAVVPAQAQGLGNPFAGAPGAGFGPYGNATGANVHLMQMAPLGRSGATPAAVAAGRAATTSETKESQHNPELREGIRLLEAMFVGCAAGAFLGGYTAWATVVPAAEIAVAAAPAATPVAAGLASAAAIGCGLGAATATVTVAAGAVWGWVVR